MRYAILGGASAIAIAMGIAASPTIARAQDAEREIAEELRGGVLNVFDQEPAEWTGAGATELGLYDLVQRRYYVGLKFRF